MAENNHFVILKGRQGTGKTTLAMYLASIYMKRKYKLAILGKDDRGTLADIQKSSEKFVVILDEWLDTDVTDTRTTERQSDMLNSHNFQNDFKVIVTANHLDEHRHEKLRLNGIVTENNVVNLDEESPENIEDNQSIMRCLLTKYNRELSEDAIIEAAATNTYYGFPLHCVLFCQDSRYFELGSKYFRQPPVALMDNINELKKSEKQQDMIMYCILVYILLNHENGLQIDDMDIAYITTFRKEVYKTWFWRTPLSGKDIKDAFRELYTKYALYVLRYKENVYLLHPVVYQAVMLSYADVCLDKMIEKCDLMQILDVVRPVTYTVLEGEVVLIIDRKQANSAEHILALRMALVCLNDKTVIPRIMHYIRNYRFTHVLQKTINHLETKLKTLITDKRIENLMILMEDMTSNGNLGLLDYTPITFVLPWACIALRKSKQNDLIKTFVDRYIERAQRELVVEIFRTIVDQHNNSFLHYCVLWWHDKENPFIRFLPKEFQHNFKQWLKFTPKNFEIVNNHQMSAVDLAAHFGNHELLKIFLILKIEIAKYQILPHGKIAKVMSVDVNRLLHYTENGKANKTINSYSSCSFIKMTVCGHIDVNDTFDYDKAVAVLTSFKEKLDHFITI